MITDSDLHCQCGTVRWTHQPAGTVLDFLDISCGIRSLRSINRFFISFTQHYPETSDNPTVPGVLVGCTNPVLLNMLSLGCLSEAFAFISALRGVAAMAGPPAAGLVVEWTGDPEVM